MLGKTRKSQLTFGEHSDANNAEEMQCTQQPMIHKKSKVFSQSKQHCSSVSEPSSYLSRSAGSREEARQKSQKSSKVLPYQYQIKVSKHKQSQEKNGNSQMSYSGGTSRNKGTSGSESNKIQSASTSKKESTQDEPCPICVSRVTASSKVNFSKLMDEEKELRFKNMSKEIKHLRRKMRAMEGKLPNQNLVELPQENEGDEKPEDIYLQAEEYLHEKKKKLEIQDSSKVLRTLAEIIVEKKEVIKSLEFNLICTIVRKLRSYNSSKQVALTMAEVNFFNSNNKANIIQTLIGGESKQIQTKRNPQEQVRREWNPQFKLPPLKQQVLGQSMSVMPAKTLHDNSVKSHHSQMMVSSSSFPAHPSLSSGCVIYFPRPAPVMMNKVCPLPLNQPNNIFGTHTNQFVGLNAGMLQQFNEETQQIDGRQNKEGYIIEKR